jgi:GTP-binding protein
MPGKTVLINFYDYMGKMLFTDLPGYGYAKVAKKTMRSWKGLVEDYLLNRESLNAIFIICDVRRGIEDEEKEFTTWLRQVGLPFYLVFTKTDKLSTNELARQKKVISSSSGSIKTGIFYVSVLKKSGIEELKTEINNIGGI